MRVAELMSTRVITVHEDTSVADLLALLDTHQITGVPVVDGGDRLVGIVSRHDIVREELRLLEGEPTAPSTLDQILDTGYATVSGEGLRSRSTRVREIMTSAERVLSCRPDTPLQDACRLMVDNHIHRLPVLKGRRLAGILTTIDVVRAVADGRR